MIKTFIIITLLFVCVCSRSPFPDLTTDDFQNQCLNLHNYYRARHNTPLLKLDPNIIAYAKSRCNTVSQYEGLAEGHAGLQKTYGENLYWAGSSGKIAVNATPAIKAWYDESINYNYGGDYQSGKGHFTQVVWKSTTRLGCAACGGQGSKWYEVYTVCDYQTPGNYIGQFQMNVLPPN